MIDWEEEERTRRSLERRLTDAHIGRFKPLCDFDWAWPKRCDRAAVEALMALDFLKCAFRRSRAVKPIDGGQLIRRIAGSCGVGQFGSCRLSLEVVL